MRIASLAVICVLTGTATADVELRNDGFEEGDQVGFQGGFVAGEIGAARFVAPEAGRTLLKIQMLFGGGSTATETITLNVYDDTAGALDPGAILYTGDFEVTGSDSAMHELATTDMQVTLPAQFRVGVQFMHDGAPSIAADKDGQMAAKNFIFANPGGWIAAPGALGDWVIRAFVSGTGGPGVCGGTACTANPDCPAGEFCDTVGGSCTCECQGDEDCGDGTCNSLGQCVAGGGGDGSGGCCRTDRGGGEVGALVLGAVVVLGIRRRRCAR